jgi:hypothetical protein
MPIGFMGYAPPGGRRGDGQPAKPGRPRRGDRAKVKASRRAAKRKR